MAGEIEVIKRQDAYGNMINVRCYLWGRYRVREWPDGSVLVEFKSGRWRSFDADHWVAKCCRRDIVWEQSRLGDRLLEDAERRSKAGSHEPITYYVDRDGRIGVPPDPRLPPPDNVTVHYANTLAEVDRLSRTMQRQMYEEFQDGGVATAAFDKMVGFNRDEMLRGAKTNKGREMVREMLRDLEKEERDRQRISTEAYFHFREYDGK